jgi:hypothetical protein
MAHEGEKQVNFWIPENFRNHLVRRVEDERRTMTDVVTDLIREDIALHNGELMQNNTLVVLQEIKEHGLWCIAWKHLKCLEQFNRLGNCTEVRWELFV